MEAEKVVSKVLRRLVELAKNRDLKKAIKDAADEFDPPEAHPAGPTYICSRCEQLRKERDAALHACAEMEFERDAAREKLAEVRRNLSAILEKMREPSA